MSLPVLTVLVKKNFFVSSGDSFVFDGQRCCLDSDAAKDVNDTVKEIFCDPSLLGDAISDDVMVNVHLDRVDGEVISISMRNVLLALNVIG